MSPLVVAPVDPQKLAEQVARGAAWLAQVVAQRRRRQEQSAALIVHDLGRMLTAIHTLDKGGLAATAPLLRYGPEWSTDEKRKVFDAITTFLADPVIEPEIRRSAAALEHISHNLDEGTYRLDDEIGQCVEGLADGLDLELRDDKYRPSGMGFLMSASRVGTVVLDGVALLHENTHSVLRTLWLEMQMAVVREELDSLVRLRKEVRDLVDLRLVEPVDSRFGALQAAVAIRYPKMPPPTWLSGGEAAGLRE